MIINLFFKEKTPSRKYKWDENIIFANQIPDFDYYD